MANPDMIARLAELTEFAELKRFVEEMRIDELETLGRRTFANPEEHDRIEWERLKARWHAIDQLLELPAKLGRKKGSA